MLANAMSAALVFQNNGGGVTGLLVSVLEKKKLEQFRDSVNERLFADNEGLRHEEMMRAQAMQLHMQQQGLHLQQEQLRATQMPPGYGNQNGQVAPNPMPLGGQQPGPFSPAAE
jgi:hypothetical protein